MCAFWLKKLIRTKSVGRVTMKWCTVLLAGCVFVISAINAQEELDYSWATRTRPTQRSRTSSLCLTPKYYSPGTCVPITKCPAAVKILRKGELSLSNKQLLQQSLCSFEYEVPVMCCSHPASNPSLPSPHSDPPPPPPISSDRTPTPPISRTYSKENHANAKLLPEDCGQSSPNGRIFGGKQASLGDFPWMVLLKYRTKGRDEFHCGGVLISDRYVATAAHCVGNNLPPQYRLLSVRIGEHNINTNPDCATPPGGETFCNPPVQDIQVVESISHPEYNGQDSRRRYNDIALLRLRNPVRFSGSVQPICLPFGDVGRADLGHRRLWVAGWGRTPTRLQSDVKLKVDVPVVGQDHCTSVFRDISDIDYTKQICAGGESGKDSCDGDSGGPLMLTSKGSMYLHGLVSYGSASCGVTGFPGVYTKVSAYLDWILDNIRA